MDKCEACYKAEQMRRENLAIEATWFITDHLETWHCTCEEEADND